MVLFAAFALAATGLRALSLSDEHGLNLASKEARFR